MRRLARRVFTLLKYGSAADELAFFCEAEPVGHFVAWSYPTVPGRYRYVAYRGPGHYNMGMALEAGTHPRCTFDRTGRGISFAVVGRPEYGPRTRMVLLYKRAIEQRVPSGGD